MLNPGQIFKTQAMAPSLMRYIMNNSIDQELTFLLMLFKSNIIFKLSSSKSKWDEPITIAPILYAKFNVPFPNKSK